MKKKKTITIYFGTRSGFIDSLSLERDDVDAVARNLVNNDWVELPMPYGYKMINSRNVLWFEIKE